MVITKTKIIPRFAIAVMLLLCSVLCRAQTKTDTAKFSWSDSYSYPSQPVYTKEQFVLDTLRTLMLVSDTSCYGAITTAYYTNPIARAEQENHSVNWIRGFCIRQKKGYSEIVKYVDDEMRPLPRTVIVWESISFK